MPRSKSPYIMKLTKAQKRLADRLRRGSLMMFDMSDGFMIDGKPVNAVVAESAIKKGIVRGQGDGMFGCRPQSYELNPAVLR